LYFWLDPKVPKDQVSRYASLRSWPLRCKAGKTWAGTRCRIVTRGPALQATFPTALQPHKATIVLPAFIRSGPADRATPHFY